MWSILLVTCGLLVTVVTSQTVYILPTEDTPCPTNNPSTCSTLDQYAQLWLGAVSPVSTDSTITLIFVSGQHTLSSRLQIGNVTQLVLRVEQANTSPPVTVACSNSTGFLFESISEVIISGLVFNGCRENSVRSLDILRIEKCLFENVHGVELRNVPIVSFETSIFISLSAFNEMELGGAITAFESGNVNVSGCRFELNTANDDGGAIYTDNSISVYDSMFIGNSATNDGGAIMSGVGDIIIRNSQFNNNTVGDDGGAVTSRSGSISVYGSSFIHNTGIENGGALYTIMGPIDAHDSIFIGNRAGEGAGINALRNSVTVVNCTFINNTATPAEEQGCGGAIEASESVYVNDSMFYNNMAGSEGGAVRTRGAIDIYNSNFSNNVAGVGGGAVGALRSITTLVGCYFSNNTAVYEGGAVYTSSGLINIDTCVFRNNSAGDEGGAVRSAFGDINVNNSTFIDNSVTYEGGAIRMSTANLFITNSVFYNNVAMLDGGGAVLTVRGLITIEDSAFNNNIAGDEGGAIATVGSLINIRGNDFNHNMASTEGGAIRTFADMNIFDSRFIGNTAGTDGGAVFMDRNTNNALSVFNNTNFSNNYATNQGAAIYVRSRNVNFDGFLEITNNSAMTGMVYVSRSTLVFSGNTTISENKASFYIIESDVTFIEDTTFLRNIHVDNATLKEGGAVTCIQSELSFVRDVVMINNAVLLGRGGAILSHDSNISSYGDTNITRNIAMFGGGVYANASELNFRDKTVISENLDTLQSEISRLCFCTNNQPDCVNPQPPDYSVVKGETFQVSLVVVDQDGNPIPSSVRAFLSSNSRGLSEGEYMQNTSSSCTELNYTITSPLDLEQLVLSTDSAIIFEARINVLFLPCNCPFGFVPSLQNGQSDCNCECDPCLFPEFVSNCFPVNSTLQIRDQVWIGFSNEIDENVGNRCQYVTHSNCPFDYCSSTRSEVDQVQLNLNTAIGPDAQCAFNRSGKLCGSCADGLSLTLGFPRCSSCSNNWLALLIIFAVAGIVLVAFLLVFNFTVAVGTVNGLIFYANILKVNRSAFFPFQSPNFFTVFIAWLNLDFGFVTCFFDGMDAYGKEWLQLLFPIYVTFIISMVIIAFKCSTRIAKLFNRTNPVLTLATVILLSFTKYLRFIIATFSSAILENPSGSRDSVWLIDANVQFLAGKHIALFLVALIVLLLITFYAGFVFSYQWLLLFSENKALKWIKMSWFSEFIEAYNAPLDMKHRYWTGVLLFVRIFLFAVAALSRYPESNLFLIICILLGLMLLKFVLPGRIYKSWALDMLEVSFIFNLMFFTAGSLYIQASTQGNQEALAYISNAVAFITFLAVLIYHTYAFILPMNARNKIDSFIVKLKEMFTKETKANSNNDLELEHNMDRKPETDATATIPDPIPDSEHIYADPSEPITTPEKEIVEESGMDKDTGDEEGTETELDPKSGPTYIN